MSWAVITRDDILSRLSAPEVSALDSAATESGQPDRLDALIALVTDQVRGKVAACAVNRNLMGPASTVPSELKLAALNIIRFELTTSLPGLDSLNDDARRRDYENALKALDDAAACELVLVGYGYTDYTPGPSKTGGAWRFGWFGDCPVSTPYWRCP